MSRYFFHITDHHVMIDGTGLELDSVEDARLEACRRVCRMLADDTSFWRGGGWHVAVTDEGGHTAFSISANIRIYQH